MWLQTALGVLALLLVGVGWFDLSGRRIPNALSVTIALSGLLVQTMLGGWTTLASGLAAMAIALVLLMLPWRAGVLGGGDVKLIGACALWTGLGGLVPFLLATGALGGVLAVVYAVRFSRRASIPYSLAIGLGALGVLGRAWLWS